MVATTLPDIRMAVLDQRMNRGRPKRRPKAESSAGRLLFANTSTGFSAKARSIQGKRRIVERLRQIDAERFGAKRLAERAQLW